MFELHQKCWRVLKPGWKARKIGFHALEFGLVVAGKNEKKNGNQISKQIHLVYYGIIIVWKLTFKKV